MSPREPIGRVPLTIGVLTLNEEARLPRALDSVSFAREIILVDAGSTDRTLEIARAAGATVLSNGPTHDYAQARNRVLDGATNEWVLFVDADEEVSQELRASITRALSRLDGPVGYWISRRDVFLGRLLRHGNSADEFIRLARKSAGRFERAVHEVWAVAGPTERLGGFLYHYSHASVGSFVAKTNRYTDMDARVAYDAGERVGAFQVFAYPVGKFFTAYLRRQGFRDGMHGLVFACLDALSSLLKRLKIWQLGLGEAARADQTRGKDT